MLRVILATLGVALIAFGLFGGKSLEQVYAGLTGAYEKLNPGDSSQSMVAETTVDDSSTPSLENVNAIVAVNTAVDDSKIVKVVVPSTSENVTDPLVTKAVLVTGSDERALNIAIESADNDSDAGLVQASLEANSVSSGAMQEVKASARNDELELAQGAVEGENLDLSKQVDVGGVLLTTAGSAKTEALFVLKDLVNMRQGPSIEHAIVLRLEKGQELMEFKREGKWVHVGAYGTSGKIGWVHERLVGKTAN